MIISCRPFVNVWLARTGFSIWSLWHVSLFSLCFGHQSWILAWDMASLGCHLGVTGFIIHIVHERTKQKGDMGLISCEPPFFKEKERGLERERDFFKPPSHWADRAGSGAQICWPLQGPSSPAHTVSVSCGQTWSSMRCWEGNPLLWEHYFLGIVLDAWSTLAHFILTAHLPERYLHEATDIGIRG